MSDMTTPAERARLRSVLSEHGTPQAEDRIILRLLNTIEQAEARAKDNSEALTAAYMSGKYDGRKEAEARAERAEKELSGADAEITELRDELEDSRGTEKDAPNVLCAIARLVGVYEHCQEIGDDMGTMSLDAVQDLIADKQTAEARDLRWTNEPPKVAGWYWWRSGPGQNAITIRVHENIRAVLFGEPCDPEEKVIGYWGQNDTFRTDLNRGEWAGPLAPPAE